MDRHSPYFTGVLALAYSLPDHLRHLHRSASAQLWKVNCWYPIAPGSPDKLIEVVRPSGFVPSCLWPCISSLSPIREHAFFQKPVLHEQFYQSFLQDKDLTTQFLHFTRDDFSDHVACQPFMSGFKNVFQPTIVHVFGIDALLLVVWLYNTLFNTQHISSQSEFFLQKDAHTSLAPHISKTIFTTLDLVDFAFVIIKARPRGWKAS